MKLQNKQIDKRLNSNLKIFLSSVFVIFLIVIAGGVSWNSPIDLFVGFEDTTYYYNVSNNVSSIGDNLEIYIDALEQKKIEWNNGTHLLNYSSLSSLSWFNYNETSFIFTITNSYDNESGWFKIPFQAKDNVTTAGVNTFLEFMINATNDAPSFVDFQENLIKYIDGSEIEINFSAVDEEEHYPLNFSLSFNGDCTHAVWSNKTNCTLNYEWENIEGLENTSKKIKFKDLSKDDVGIYNITFCVNDSTSGSTLPSYREENYEDSKQTCNNLTLDLRHVLTLNDLNCSGISMLDNETSFCQIEIETENPSSSLIIWSVANFTESYNSPLNYNSSWFYPNVSTNAENYRYLVNISITPEMKKGVGWWNVTFWAHDSTPPYNNETTPRSTQILINVTPSSYYTPVLSEISNLEVSMDLETEILFSVRDDDFLIPDKRIYNESLIVSVDFFNQSNLESVSSFGNFIDSLVNSSGNLSNYKLVFTANSSEVGDYTLNVSVSDYEDELDYQLFNISILSNRAPEWDFEKEYSFLGQVYSSYNTSNNFTLNLSDRISDLEGDAISFSYQKISGEGSFLNSSNFNSSTGLINLTLWKEHVGYFEYNISAQDSKGLRNTTTFHFNITNNNSPPIITRFENGTFMSGTQISNNSLIYLQENYLSKLFLSVRDYDLFILQEDKYNESLNVSVVVENLTQVEEVFNLTFLVDLLPPEGGLDDDQMVFLSEYTPSKLNVGNYSVKLNLSDQSGEFDYFVFNISVIQFNNAPELINVINLSSKINDSLSYQFRANDTENGNSWTDGNLNFSFSLEVLEGEDIFNETNFNSSTGALNISFNESNAGKYLINISVNDSGLEGRDEPNKTASQLFWLFVYDFPDVLYFNVTDYNSLQENQTFQINVSANHSVGDSLIYELWMGERFFNGTDFEISNYSKRTNLTSYGNSTNVSLYFNSSFSDETYGSLKNLTLKVYPSNSEIEDVFTETNLSLNISHLNYPITFLNPIPNQEANKGETINISLRNYFYDLDYEDLYYNQSFDFEVISNTTPSKISYSSQEGWFLILSSSEVSIENLQINSSDLDDSNNSLNSSLSNEFVVSFKEATTPSTGTTSSSGGGSSTRTIEVPVALKLIVPGTISTGSSKIITVPLQIKNQGSFTLKQINLYSNILKEGLLLENSSSLFSENYFEELKPGESRNVTLTILNNFDSFGTYEVNLNATSQSPKYEDWAKIQILFEKGNEVLERMIFAEEFIAENPECLEIREAVDIARKLYQEGKVEESLEMINQAIQSCKDAVGQKIVFSRKIRANLEDEIFDYLLKIIVVSVVLGMAYYLTKRIQLKKQ